MKFGLASINSGNNSYPESLARLARAAESAGFDSLWAGGHPFLSEKQTRMPPSLRMLDPLISLSFVAANTSTIRLGVGILLLPQFDPVIAAKQLASLDVLSGGRLMVGIGVGWSEHEYDVLRISYRTRGRRADDYLKAMKVLWGQDRPAYRGRFVEFDSLQAHPRPVQQPAPPIVIGGASEGAYRRAVEQANGWYGFGMDVEGARAAIAGLRKAEKEFSRPAGLGPLEITVASRVPVDKGVAQQFASLGVDRLNLIPPANADASSVEGFIRTSASALIGHV